MQSIEVDNNKESAKESTKEDHIQSIEVDINKESAEEITATENNEVETNQDTTEKTLEDNGPENNEISTSEETPKKNQKDGLTTVCNGDMDQELQGNDETKESIENEKEEKLDETEKSASESLTNGEKSQTMDIEDCDKSSETNKYFDEMEMDDDFDPSMFCPEVSMAVEENPITTAGSTTSVDTTEAVEATEFSDIQDILSALCKKTSESVSFKLNEEEETFKNKLYGPTNNVQYSKIHCTACNVHLGSALKSKIKRFVHPLLKVLICEKCHKFYTSGDFEKDDDGSELYCRWCGQGGQVLCCSQCEFVFCKRCIRTNFGRVKVLQIRDSDDWKCFRCKPSQLTLQKIQCYEFTEYIMKESKRVAALNDSELWYKDYCKCCVSNKRSLVGTENQPKKAKRRKPDNFDPQYIPPQPEKIPKIPMKLIEPPVLKKTITKPISFLPQSMAQKFRDLTVPQGNIRPMIGGFRAILPNTIKIGSPPALVSLKKPVLTPAPRPAPRLLTTIGDNRILTTVSQNQSSALTSAGMKHEWFEKTSREAARISSQLSSTLGHLTKEQAKAASIEELAIVHNSLQEILSTSINNLIHIRKNLRNKFIDELKNVRLPAKKGVTGGVTVVSKAAPTGTMRKIGNNDVVLISSQPSTSKKVVLNPVYYVKDNTATDNKPSRSGNKVINSSIKLTGGVLKVRSVADLQRVPSECITIPDDPLPPLISYNAATSNLTQNCNPLKKDQSGTVQAVEKNSAVKESVVTGINKEMKETSACNGVLDAVEKNGEKETSTNEIDEGDSSADCVVIDVDPLPNNSEADTTGPPTIPDTNSDIVAEASGVEKHIRMCKVVLKRMDLMELQKRLLDEHQHNV